MNLNKAILDMGKNILVLNYEFPPLGGGAAPVSYDISKGYVEEGCNVDVVTMGFDALPKYENKDGLNIYRVKCLRREKEVCHPREQLTYLISGYFKIKELLRSKKYNLCHCHFLVPTGILALVLKNKYGLKYIVTSHGSDVPGHNPDRFKFLHKFTPWIIKRIINSAERVIVPSKYLGDLIKKNIKGINNSIEVIPNGIDTKRFVPLKKENIILGTGRLWPLKGLHLLADAFSKIEDVNGYELHICGDGPLMNEMKLIQKKSKNKIVLHGWVDNESKEYIELLGKAKIYCLPSVSENSPVSILEGMSSGCVVFSTSIAGCYEMVKDVGIFVEPDLEDIKGKLENTIMREDIGNFGEKARKKATDIYDKKAIVEKYVSFAKICVN